MTKRPWTARVLSQSTVTPLHKFLTGATKRRAMKKKIKTNLNLLSAMPLVINLNAEILIFPELLVLVLGQYKPWSLLSSTTPTTKPESKMLQESSHDCSPYTLEKEPAKQRLIARENTKFYMLQSQYTQLIVFLCNSI